MKKIRNKAKNWLLSIFAVAILAIVAVWPTNYFVETPGDALPVGQFIRAKRKSPNNFYLVTVAQSAQPVSVFSYLWSYTDQFAQRIPASELLAGQTSKQYQELQNWYMETSQQNAIYYAAKKAKLKPRLKYYGVYVMQVQKNSSFLHKLQLGDTILKVNGHRFHSTKEMMNLLQQKRIGTRVIISILRNKQVKQFTGKIVRVKGTNKPGIGIGLVEHTKVTTKPKLTINAGAIGGPSAGLMFTLASYESFTGINLTNGHKVAGTGTIDDSGKVGMIGGVDKKVVAASKAGAEVFFAPTDTSGVPNEPSNYVVAKKTAKQIHTKMKIVPVGTFEDAVRYLRMHYK